MEIAFLGDSITYGYGLEDRSMCYTTLLCRSLGVSERNCGITGTLMARAGMNRTDGNSFLDRLELVDGADLVVIFGGTNDYFWSDRPIAPPDSADAGEDYFSAAADSLCRTLGAKRPTGKNLLVTPYPHCGIGNHRGGKDYLDSDKHITDSPNYHGHCLNDYVSVLEKTGRKYGIPVLNLHKDFPFDHTLHTLDGCHPNVVGHRLLAAALEKIIRIHGEDITIELNN